MKNCCELKSHFIIWDYFLHIVQLKIATRCVNINLLATIRCKFRNNM